MADEEKMDQASERSRLEAEIGKEQEELVGQERVYRLRISELEEELENVRRERLAWMQDDEQMQHLGSLHEDILRNVDTLQKNTIQLVQEQERDLLNAFRSRLVDIQQELEKEREKKDDGAAAWIDRSRKLEIAVHKEREKADKLDRLNQSLTSENSRLRQQFENQSQDKVFLNKQLTLLKQQNEQFQDILTTKQAQDQTLPNDISLSLTHQKETNKKFPTLKNDTKSQTRSVDSQILFQSTKAENAHSFRPDATYREMAKKLSRMLNMERKHVAQVKEAHEQWSKNRTPLELALRRAAIEIAGDVKKRITLSSNPTTEHKVASQAEPTVLDPALLAQFTHEDREKTVELWLSFDGVLDALYSDEQQDSKSGRRHNDDEQLPDTSLPENNSLTNVVPTATTQNGESDLAADALLASVTTAAAG